MLRECWFEVYAPWHIVVLATIITIKFQNGMPLNPDLALRLAGWGASAPVQLKSNRSADGTIR